MGYEPLDSWRSAEIAETCARAASPACRVRVGSSARFVRALASPEERMLTEAYDIGMTQRGSEIRSLATLVRELRPERVLEIGTSRGGTFYLWTRLAGDEATLISVDLPPSWALDDPEEALKRDLFQSFQRGRQALHFVRRDSHLAETQNEVLAILAGTPLDFPLRRWRPLL